MIPAQFEYVRPTSRDAVFAALADPEAKVIAGGHSLIPMMKLRMAMPGTLVDIEELGLRGIDVDGDDVRIGALTTYADVLEADPRAGLPEVLRECAAAVGDVQVRNAGTVGGAIAHGDPASDFAAGVLALGAQLVLDGPSGSRTVAAEDFFVGPYTTALEQQELLVEIVVPQPPAGAGTGYVSFEDPASGYPLVGCAARVDGASVSIGMCGVGGRPLRPAAVEAAIAAHGDLRDALAELGELDDYRTQLTLTAIRRAVELARSRAR